MAAPSRTGHSRIPQISSNSVPKSSRPGFWTHAANQEVKLPRGGQKNAGQVLFQTVWFMIPLFIELAVILVLRTRKPMFRSRRSRLLPWSTIVVADATFAIPFLGRLSELFGFVPLSAKELAAVVLIVGGDIIATAVAKKLFFRNENAALGQHE